MVKVRLEFIENYFENMDFTDDHLQLDQATVIIDIKRFYESHLTLLKANKGNKTVMPYYYRLLKLYYIYKQT